MSRQMGDERAGSATQPKQADKSLGELFSDMSTDLGLLFKQELRLAKVEARDEAKRLGRAAGMFGGAGLGAWLALLFLSLALAWLLDQAMNTALAFAIVGVLWAIAAAVLFGTAKRGVRQVEALPETRETLKEDVEWIKKQKS